MFGVRLGTLPLQSTISVEEIRAKARLDGGWDSPPRLSCSIVSCKHIQVELVSVPGPRFYCSFWRHELGPLGEVVFGLTFFLYMPNLGSASEAGFGLVRQCQFGFAVLCSFAGGCLLSLGEPSWYSGWASSW